MRTLLSLTFLLLTSNIIFGQECLQLTPDVKIMGLEKRINVNLEDMEPVTLPVVFHVIHKGEGDVTNISDEQVLSQIPALNTGFRWGPGVDTKIEFCLASRDPEGNPTSGITRHNGTSLFGQTYAEYGIASSAFLDGVNDGQLKSTVGCWNPDEYINFYVVSEINGNNGGGGIQGYAFVGGYSNGPNGGCGDGIVQLYNVTGTTGTLKSGREQGETGVHEMGHHLNLYHTFTANNGTCVETNCETQGDQVCDTPPTTTNYSCDASVFGDCPDAMTENFMDYTPETCRETFSVGQAERMWEHLLSEKQELIDSYACIAPVDYDMAVTSANYQSPWCTPYQDVWVTVTNQGNNIIGVANVEVYCNGEQYVKTIYDIGPDAGLSVLFEDVYVEDAQIIECQVVSVVDEYPDNDYAWFEIEHTDGDLMTITVETDVWSNETDWAVYDSTGEIVIADGNYPVFSQDIVFTYEVCIYEDCYDVVIEDSAGDGFCSFDLNNDGVCDNGAQGITMYVGADTVFQTPFGAEFDVYEGSFCNTLPACPLDFDGSGTIGNGDILIMLTNLGCEGPACTGDANNDGIVNVLDLLEMLSLVGTCPVEQDFSIGTYKDLVVGGEQALSVGVFGRPKVYDVAGRRVEGPIENLATGVYILKWKNETKKVFVQ